MTIANKIVLDGDVVYGPTTAANNRIAVFDGTTGKLVKDGGKTIDELDPIGVVKFNQAQTLSASEKVQARANIGVDILGNYRNKIMNGDFLFRSRGVSFSLPAGNSIYVAERWVVENFANQALTVILNLPNPNSFIDVDSPGFISFNYPTAPTTGGFTLRQPIPEANTFNGRIATFGAYFATSSGTGGQAISSSVIQNFGSTGSPSPQVSTPISLNASSLTGQGQHIRGIVTLPSTTSKTYGSNHFIMPSFTVQPRTTEAVYITHVFFVEGDSRTERDPFEKRPFVVEQDMVRQFYRNLDNTLTLNGNPNVANSNKMFISPAMYKTPTVIQATAGSGATWLATTLDSLGQSGVHSSDQGTTTLRLDSEF